MLLILISDLWVQMSLFIGFIGLVFGLALDLVTPRIGVVVVRPTPLTLALSKAKPRLAFFVVGPTLRLAFFVVGPMAPTFFASKICRVLLRVGV